MTEVTNETLNIVELIEKNPLTKFNTKTNSKVLEKIKTKFDSNTQKLFVSTFYVYLNYDSKKDFVIDLNDVWKWCGFSRKDPAKRLLSSYFKKDIDYLITTNEGIKKSAPLNGGIKNYGGDRKSETILMTVNTFKKFCLKARTDKADEIHDYFIALEEVIHEIAEEEAQEMVHQLTVRDQENQKNLIENFREKPIVYLGIVDSQTVKFGYSNNIHNRVKEHQREIHKDFTIRYVYESIYNREIEKEIKRHKFLSTKIKTKDINSKKQTELIKLDDELSLEDLNNIVIEIRDEVESYEKDKDKTLLIKKLNLELKVLKQENEELKERNYKLEDELQLSNTENNILKQFKITTYSNARIEDLQKAFIELKKNVFMHFFIDFIANNMKLTNYEPYTSIRMSYSELLDKYKEYRKGSSYMEPFHDNSYEIRMIGKCLHGIPGIDFYSPDDSPRIRVFGIKTIGEWIARNCILPRQYRNVFLKLVIKDDYYQRVTKKKDMSNEISHIYNFLLVLLLKNISDQGISSAGNNIFRISNKTSNTKIIYILHKIVSDEYLNFYINDSYKKKLTINRINEEIKNIPGVFINYRILKHEYKRALKLETDKLIPWIKSNISLDSRTLNILDKAYNSNSANL